MATTAILKADGSSEVPALRPPGNQPDELDSKRSQWAWERFQCQDGSYRLRDRSIEENIRMLSGQQWWQYHHLLGWKDITYWMTDEEKRWRQRPVFNRILPWFILTHARMTENPFICTFLPGPDRKDSELAETLDVLYKAKWRDTGMTDVWDRCAGWMISAGAAFLETRIDLNKGEWEPWVGQADVPVHGPDGVQLVGPDGQPVTKFMPKGVPFDKEGKPLLRIKTDGVSEDFEELGEPHAERRGDIAMNVRSPLEVRGQWGPLPWHEQRIHMSRSYLTPEEVWEIYEIECEPDVRGEAASSAGFLERMMFGSGFFGAASAMLGSEFSNTGNAKDGYCCVQTTWQAPSRRIEGMDESPTKPGGRMLVSTREKVLRDGPRPFPFKYTSPLRCFEFLRLPGRPGGSTPQETMNSPQKAYNTGWKQVLENRALCANPQQVYDRQSGLRAEQVDNQPGRQYGVKMRAGVIPIQWIVPPAMGSDVWRSQDALQAELDYLGATRNTSGQITSEDASGELIKELRFNDDRYLGPTMRRAAEEMGRVQQDWMVILPFLYDRETILKYTGDDNVARTLVLMPDILKTASADVVPDLESMLPEGRGDRRARIYKMWQDGAFGDPLGPEALRKLHELSKFPHMSRTSKPGGIHWTTAEQENGELLQGGMPPTYEWYNDEVHLACIEEFMAAPEWRRLPDDVKMGFVVHWRMHQANLAKKQQAKMAQAVAEQTLMNAAGGKPDPTGKKVGPGGKPGGQPGGLPKPGQPAAKAPTSPGGISDAS